MFLGFEGTKKIILEILLDEKTLSAKEIYNRTKHKSNKQLTYQAVHKTLNFFVEKKILNKSNGIYSINKLWVFSAKNILGNLDKSITESTKGAFLTRPIIFDSIYECDKFLANIKDLFAPKENDEFGLVWIHFWIPLFFSNEVYSNMKELLLGSKFYCITPSSSKVDKWCEIFGKN